MHTTWIKGPHLNQRTTLTVEQNLTSEISCLIINEYLSRAVLLHYNLSLTYVSIFNAGIWNNIITIIAIFSSSSCNIRVPAVGLEIIYICLDFVGLNLHLFISWGHYLLMLTIFAWCYFLFVNKNEFKDFSS